MVACGELRSKFVGGIDRRIDVPAEAFLGRRERMHKVLEPRLANHQEVDVAGRPELAAGRGPEHERNLNAIGE